MRHISISRVLQILFYLIGLSVFIFLSNAFFGTITFDQGKVERKFIEENAQGKQFYRVCILIDSTIVELQAQPSDYKVLEIGDSITYSTRLGLYDNKIIERYNAKIK